VTPLDTLVRAAQADLRARLRTLRDTLVGRLAGVVAPDASGAPVVPLAALGGLLTTLGHATDTWAAGWEASLPVVVRAAAHQGQDDVDAPVVHAIRTHGRHLLREAVSAADARVLDALGLHLPDVTERAIHAVLQVFTVHLVAELSAETKLTIGRIIRAGAAGAVPPLDLMRAVTAVLEGAGAENLGSRQGRVTPDVAARAEVIVRTELGRAYNTASDARQQQLGAAIPGLMKQWVNVPDKRCRPAHRRAGAEDPIPIDEPFLVGGEALRYPLDPKGSPANTVNCRCRSAVVVPEDAFGPATGEGARAGVSVSLTAE
jgi:hypothetical protein